MKWFSNSLPESWRIRKLKRVTTLRYGDSLAVDDREEGDIAVYGSNGIVGSHNVTNQMGPGLIVGRKGSYGKVTYTTDPAFVIDTAYGIDSRGSRNDLRWLYYSLSSSTIDQKMRDSPVPGLASRDAYGIDFPLPPLPEQKRIAAYLDASCAVIDRAVETKQKQLETLDALRKSIIQKAVTHGLNPNVEMKDSGVEWLGPIPNHWKVQKLKRVFSKVDYGISQSTEQEGIYAVLKMGNIVKGEIAFTKIEFVPDVTPDLILEKDDLLFNRTNSLDQVAKVAIFRGNRTDNVTYASYLVRLRTNHKNCPSYLNYLANADIFLGLARKMAIPSVQQANLNPTRYCRLGIPVPPLSEQIEIASFIDMRAEQICKIKQILNEQIATLTAYRKSLIHECVTGKRRISDADVSAVQHGRLDAQAQ